jgi:ATP-dependent exoDNAse (exonuclease V) beta subunit
MKREPADQQVRLDAARRIEENIFLDAGAGCGKTQALTARYLSLLEQGCDVTEIVAVTFTNKAARDMKARLRRECEQQARSAADVKESALWLRRARRLENAPISTIHSFCASLLRRYALRAGLDPNFTVMDEVTGALLRHDTLRRALLDRLDADETTAALAVSALGLADALAAIAKLLSAREERQQELEHPPSAADLLERWERQKSAFMLQRLNLLIASPPWQRHAATLRQHVGAEPSDRLERLRTDLLTLIGVAENRATSLEDRLASLRCIFDLGTVPSKGRGWDEEAATAVAKACREFKTSDGHPSKQIKELCSEEQADPAPAADLTAAVYQEAHHAHVAYQQAKDADALLDYEDLQIIARDLLASNESVRRDCHERYRHVLVDEFQDTNALQRDLLWLVAGGAPGSPPPPGRLFVVGDAKQSIYRFRDADVTVFDATRDQFAAAPGCDRLRLAVTFRSLPAVVDLHNRLFASSLLMGPDHPDRAPYEAFYEPLTAHRPACQEDIACDLLFTQSDDARSAEALREAEAGALAAWLKQNIGKLQVRERLNEDGDEAARPCQPGDIALLFRAMSDVRLYERALRLQGLDYHISSGRGFFTCQEVLDLINLLAALENWQDEIALAGALRSPLFGLSDETLFWLKQGRLTLAAGLQAFAESRHPEQSALAPEELSRVAFAWEQIADLRDLKNRLPLSGLLSQIVARTGFTAALAGLYDGSQQIGNVRKLIEIAGAFENSGHYSLREFIDYLRDLVTTEERMAQAPVVEEQADCLKLMTVHAAKGLEWPIVIVPDLARGTAGPSGAFRTHRAYGLVAAPEVEGERQWPLLGRLMADLDEAEELAERKRLLYVALTRCQDRLVLSSALGFRGADSWFEWLCAAIEPDLEGGCCAMPGVAVRALTPPREQGPRPSRRAASPLAAAADPAHVRRRLQPLPLDPAGWHRFTVTALSAYRRCPQYFRLRYVEGLAESRPLSLDAFEERKLAASERGDLMHQALELIGTGGAEQAADALRHVLAWRVIERAAGEEMVQRLQWFLRQEVYLQQVVAADSLRSEVPVLFPLGDALIEGKIDAVAQRGTGACVLDYKTGYEEDADTPEEHIFQLGLYCAGLQTLGHTIAGAHIIYLDRQEIVPLAPQDFTAAASAARQAITSIRAGQFAPAEGDGCDRCGIRWACPT